MNPAFLAASGWVASAVGAAAALGIADLLGDEAKSVADLAHATGTREPALRHALRLLVQVGVFAEDADGRFSNTADSQLMRSDHPQSLRYICQLAAGDYQRLFTELLHTLETGEPASTKVFGASLYRYMDRTPDAADIYDRAMEDLCRPMAAALAANRDFSTARLVVDVGGGRGTLAKAIVAAHRHVRGVVADRASVCARAEADLRSSDSALAARIQYVPVNFFEELPAGGDVYLLKNVVHNLGDASTRQLFRVIGAAMRGTPDARLLVIEPHELQPLHKALDELLKVVMCEEGAAGRSIAALEALLVDAGFELAGTHLDGFGVVEARLNLRQ